MAFGAETKNSHIVYQVTLEHTPTSVRVDFELDLYKTNGDTPSEAQRDSLFQAFLNHLATLPNTTIVAATKNGKYSAPVTVS